MKNDFKTWCDERIRDCMAQRAALLADGRSDEANFMQIRANVYGIFPAVYSAVKGDLPRLMERLTSIPAAWENALREAEIHDDEAKAHIERIKLDTAAIIRHYVNNLQEMNEDD